MRFAPAAGRGVLVGGAISGLAAALGAALLIRATGGDVTFGAFLLYLVGGALALLAARFGYWTWGCATLSYEVDETALRVTWGVRRIIIPLASIDVVAAAPQPGRVRGLNWPGHHIGEALIEETTPVHVFATTFGEGDAIYVRAGTVILALTPADAGAFVAQVDGRRRGAPAYTAAPRTSAIELGSILSDGAALGLAIVSGALVAAAFAILFARYGDLPTTLTVDYPTGRDSAHLIERGDLFAIPLTGLAVLALNIALGIVLHRRQRALAQTIIGGGVFVEGILVLALAAAV